MSFFTLALIGLSLAMDCFAVSLSVGTCPFPQTHRSKFRLTFHFGLFQGGMAFIGWLLGKSVVDLIANFDHWIALGLLSFVGIRMIIDGLKPESEIFDKDPTKGKSLIILSIATSIDAMAVGLSLAVMKTNILQATLIIGLISTLMSLIGLSIGKKLGELFGQKMEIIGGLLLNGIGIKILISHIF
jgi:putative Mn2+ efflux pump MntP